MGRASLTAILYAAAACHEGGSLLQSPAGGDYPVQVNGHVASAGVKVLGEWGFSGGLHASQSVIPRASAMGAGVLDQRDAADCGSAVRRLFVGAQGCADELRRRLQHDTTDGAGHDPGREE